MTEKILVVDDDQHICDLVKLYLQKEGYDIVTAGNGPAALALFGEEAPSLVILDLMLPGMDGLACCREIRKRSDIPVIMLTAKGESFDKVLGLEMGADDYIVKPFDPRELVARVRAVLRRYNPKGEGNQQLVFPDLVIDRERYLVIAGETEMILPQKEMELLYFLASQPEHVFTREQIIKQVWGYDYVGETRTVDVHVERIRKKLQTDVSQWQIKTVWGIGYKFTRR